MRISSSLIRALAVTVLADITEARSPRYHKRAVKGADTTTPSVPRTTEAVLTTTRPPFSTTTKASLSTTTRPPTTPTTTSVAPACATDAAQICAAGNAETTCSSSSGQNYDLACGVKYLGTKSSVLKPGLARRQSFQRLLSDCQALCEAYSDCYALNYVGQICEILSIVTGIELVPGAVAAAVAGANVPAASDLPVVSTSSTTTLDQVASTIPGVEQTTPAGTTSEMESPPLQTTPAPDTSTTTAPQIPASETSLAPDTSTTAPTTTTSSLPSSCEATRAFTTDSAIFNHGGPQTSDECALDCSQDSRCQSFTFFNQLTDDGRTIFACYGYSKPLRELPLVDCSQPERCESYDLSCLGLVPAPISTTTTTTTTTTNQAGITQSTTSAFQTSITASATSTLLPSSCTPIRSQTSDGVIVNDYSVKSLQDCVEACSTKAGCQSFTYDTYIANAGQFAGQRFYQCWGYGLTISQMSNTIGCSDCESYDLTCFGLQPLPVSTMTTASATSTTIETTDTTTMTTLVTTTPTTTTTLTTTDDMTSDGTGTTTSTISSNTTTTSNFTSSDPGLSSSTSDVVTSTSTPATTADTSSETSILSSTLSSSPASTTITTSTGPMPTTLGPFNIAVQDTNGDFAGYLNQYPLSGSVYGIDRAPDDGDPMQVQFTMPDSTARSASNLNLRILNGVTTNPLYLVGAGSYYSTLADIVPGSSQYISLTDSRTVSTGSVPSRTDNVYHSQTKDTLSSIWSVDLDSMTLTPQWINQDGSLPVTYIGGMGDTQHIELGLTGDLNKYLANGVSSQSYRGYKGGPFKFILVSPSTQVKLSPPLQWMPPLPVAKPDFVTNGNFESSPDATTGWIFAGSAFVQTNSASAPLGNTDNGTHYVQLSQASLSGGSFVTSGSISQTLTDLDPSLTYQFGYSKAKYFSLYNSDGVSCVFQAFLGNQQLTQESWNGGSQQYTYRHDGFQYQPPSTTAELTFKHSCSGPLGTGDFSYFGVDSIYFAPTFAYTKVS